MPAPLLFIVDGWQRQNTQQVFDSVLPTANCATYVDGFAVVLEPDEINAGSIAQLDDIFANAAPRTDRPYLLHINMPLSSLSLPAQSYPFDLRSMLVEFGDGENIPPAQMLVPILNHKNIVPLSNWVVATWLKLLAYVAERGNGNFQVFATGHCVTSEIYFDAEQTVPSDTSETMPGQSAAVWATYNVTQDSVNAFFAAHVTAMRLAMPGVPHISFSALNPNLSQIGQVQDGGASYLAMGQAEVNALAPIGGGPVAFDQTELNDSQRSTIFSMVALCGGQYAAQLPNNQVNFLASFLYAAANGAIWIEVPSKVLAALIDEGYGSTPNFPYFYDPLAQIDTLAPGVVLQRSVLDGVMTEYAADGFLPLDQAQMIAITGPLPAYPTGLPRFPDSNPAPDGWCTFPQVAA